MTGHGRHLRPADAPRHRRRLLTQYVKLARILRDKIESGRYRRGDILPAADLAGQYKVSVRVTCSALAMLAANRYVSRPGTFRSYSVTWQAGL
jgi:DNA-binding GntR family transcriptional regulator